MRDGKKVRDGRQRTEGGESDLRDFEKLGGLESPPLPISPLSSLIPPFPVPLPLPNPSQDG
jgi:hypothetical protein